jgi:hypothetical protein
MTRIPMGRVGQPDELVGPVVFLASELSTTSPASPCPWTAVSWLSETALCPYLSRRPCRPITAKNQGDKHDFQDLQTAAGAGRCRRAGRRRAGPGHQVRLQRRPVGIASAQSGQAAVIGMQAAIDDINAAGGLLGKKIALVVRDDTSRRPSRSRT